MSSEKDINLNEEGKMNLNLTTKKKVSKKTIKKYLFVSRMLIIALLNIAIFYFYVNFKSIIMAFKIDGEAGLTLYHFKTFISELTKADSTIFKALLNTMIFFVNSIAIIFPLSLLLSYFIYKKIRCYKIFRVIFFIPGIISSVVLVIVYKNFIVPMGPLGQILNAFGVECPHWFADSRYAKWAIVLYCIWTGLGGNMILFGGAMARIPDEIVEAATLDGVGTFRELTQVVIPLIWSTICTLLVFTIVGIFTASGPILLFTQGEYDTYTISFWIFQQIERGYDPNYPSAVGLFFTLIGTPIVLILKHYLEKIGSDVEY